MSPEPHVGGNRPLTAFLSSAVRLVYGTVIVLMIDGSRFSTPALASTHPSPASPRECTEGT
jgi:hypothetical protein